MKTIQVPDETLFAIPGCGHCADLVAAGLLGADVYDRLADHQREHEPRPSIWPEVNEIARRGLAS